MKGKSFLYLILILVVGASAALMGALGGGYIVFQAVQNQLQTVRSLANQPANSTTSGSDQNPVNAATEKLVVSTTEIETAITQAVEKIGPAVVTVTTHLPGGGRRSFFSPSQGVTASGSGVIISADGYILTNNHVVEGGQTYSITLANGDELDAQLIGTDQFTDLAVLKVSGKMPAVAAFGNSDVLKPGESVIAIGSPLGDFKNSVTSGVVSATGRSLDTGNGYLMENMIQTDAAINEGNSGGPLVNLAGQVIGINTLILRSGSGASTVVEGLGFSIPSNTAQAIASQLIKNGAVARPLLGVQYQTIDPTIARMYGLPVQYGAYVTSVSSGSPADKAGIRVDDIITRLNDTAIDDTHTYINVLYSFVPGETISVTVARGNQTLTFTVTLDKSSN